MQTDEISDLRKEKAPAGLERCKGLSLHGKVNLFTASSRDHTGVRQVGSMPGLTKEF